MALSMIFGMNRSSVSMYLRFGRRLVIRILSKEPDAAIKIPSVDKIREYQASIAAKHLSLEGVWCTMNGLKLYLEQSSEAVIQNMFYNGWTHDHYVAAVFDFVLMVLFQLQHKICQDVFMIQPLLNGGKSTKSWDTFTKWSAENALLTLHFPKRLTLF